jgi:hypothetical protein
MLPATSVVRKARSARVRVICPELVRWFPAMTASLGQQPCVPTRLPGAPHPKLHTAESGVAGNRTASFCVRFDVTPSVKRSRLAKFDLLDEPDARQDDLTADRRAAAEVDARRGAISPPFSEQGPSAMAPTSPATPPVACTIVERQSR